MRGDAAYARAAWWLRSVPFLVRPDLEPEFMCTLAIRFSTNVYNRLERIPLADSKGDGYLFVVSRGLIAKNGRLGRQGACFGKDCILSNAVLRDLGDAIALCFAQVERL